MSKIATGASDETLAVSLAEREKIPRKKYKMIILLDIDGVLVTTPSWKKVEQLEDGFMKFDEKATECLAELYEETNASIILTTTHRITYSIENWKKIFHKRGLYFENISKINEKSKIEELTSRGNEIKEWVEKTGFEKNYVIIDDDLSINSLEKKIKDRVVFTKQSIGFDRNGKNKAIEILKNEIKID